MKYADYTYRTKEPLKRLAHGKRFQQAARIVPLAEEMMILDYGCGDGAFFHHLAEFTPPKNLFGFDPGLLNELNFDGATTYEAASELIANHESEFDVVFCLEVCEHLSNDAIYELLRNLRLTARQDATFVFGVPIETGLSGFLKNIYRFCRGRRQNATLGRAIKSLFGLWIPRAFSPEGWSGSHLGFDANAFRELLKYGGFEVQRTVCLPWPRLGAVFNNEIYFVCRRNQRAFDDQMSNEQNTIPRATKASSAYRPAVHKEINQRS